MSGLEETGGENVLLENFKEGITSRGIYPGGKCPAPG